MSLRSKPLLEYRLGQFHQPCIAPLGGHGPRGVDQVQMARALNSSWRFKAASIAKTKPNTNC